MKLTQNKSKFILPLLLGIVSFLTASTPQIKTYQSQSDFEKGKPKGVSINSYGDILLGPNITELFKSDLPFLWSLAIDSQANIFVGGGNSGQVFKIDPAGNSSVYFEAPELEIYALAVDKQNNLFVGTSPQGKVYKIPPGKKLNAEQALFYDPDEVYIWSLVSDSQNNLYVATGNQGKIFKVDESGNGSLFYDSEELHIRSLQFDKAGNLIAGTSDKGLILKIDLKGKAFVLYDSPLV
jgi:ligand-binding sensor domain-containing protein